MVKRPDFTDVETFTTEILNFEMLKRGSLPNREKEETLEITKYRFTTVWDLLLKNYETERFYHGK